MEWHISYFYSHYNFILLRNEFIDLIKDEIKEREYHLLKEFNVNSSMEFTEVDKKYKLEKGRTDYAYYGLKRNGVLKRATISMQNNCVNYLSLVLVSIIKANKFIKNRKRLLSDIISETEGPLSKYVLTGDIGISKGVALVLPTFQNGDLERTKEQLINLDLGATVENFIITDIILGSFCFRKFDSTYSIQYKILTRDYKMPESTIINYDTSSISKKLESVDIRGANIIDTDDEQNKR